MTWDKNRRPTKWFYAAVIFSLFSLFLYYQQSQMIYQEDVQAIPNEKYLDEVNGPMKYIVEGKHCRIPDIEPLNDDVKEFFNPENYEYVPCSELNILTFIKREGDLVTLNVNETVLPLYSKEQLSCCYSVVKRKYNKKEPDNGIALSECLKFKNNVQVFNHTLYVECRESDGTVVYRNTHAFVNYTKNMKGTKVGSKRPFSVMMVGIDGVSRLNLLRVMPKTVGYLNDNNWMNLKGYNKVELNTFPNLMAILTGMNETDAFDICKPREVGGLDNCDMMWYTFRRNGYITGYAEDDAELNTFNYNMKKGFKNPPTDFYYRTYTMASEKLLDKVIKYRMVYCTGPEVNGKRILNLAKDFATVLANTTSFGFFWTNTFSHDDLTFPTVMDGDILELIKYLTESDVGNNTIFVFLSDHGFRFGDFRLTHTGWLEERLPFIYIRLPETFQLQYPEESRNLKINRERLTSPYDLYMTLQHILPLSGIDYKVKPSRACPGCQSLFIEVDKDRSCAGAGIPLHWCTCVAHKHVDSENSLIIAAARFAIKKLWSIISSFKPEHTKCVKFNLENIREAVVSQAYDEDGRNTTYLLLILDTYPKAIFEVTLSFVMGKNNTPKFSLKSDLTRIDYYGDNSHCVFDATLKKYCYCKKIWYIIKDNFCDLFRFC